jgi:hypothetical protein
MNDDCGDLPGQPPNKPGMYIVLALGFILLLSTWLCPTRLRADDLNVDNMVAAYASGETVFTNTGQKTVPGARIYAQVGLGHWGIAFRGVVSGLPGKFNDIDPGTYRTIEGYIRLHVNLKATPGTVFGIAAITGSAMAYGLDPGQTFVATPQPMTLLIGPHVAGKGFFADAGCGIHQALPGISCAGTLQFPLSQYLSLSSDAGIGRNGQRFVRIAALVVMGQK